MTKIDNLAFIISSYSMDFFTTGQEVHAYSLSKRINQHLQHLRRNIMLSWKSLMNQFHSKYGIAEVQNNNVDVVHDSCGQTSRQVSQFFRAAAQIGNEPISQQIWYWCDPQQHYWCCTWQLRPSLETWVSPQFYIQLVYRAPLFITLKIKMWVSNIGKHDF